MAIVGVVFLSAAVDRALASDDLALVILYFLGRSTHPALISSFALILLVIECVIGVGLLTGSWRRMALPTAIVMLSMFTGALTWMMLDPASPESCGCGRMFGVITQAGSGAPFGIARNIILIGFLVVGNRLARVEGR